ncbi:MAG: hypothetical protein V1838_04970 [Patescibacteria group bacterium]
METGYYSSGKGMGFLVAAAVIALTGFFWGGSIGGDPVINNYLSPVVDSGTVLGEETESVESAAPIEPGPVTESGFACYCGKTCSDIDTCDEAFFQLRNCGCTGLDPDGDGVPCEEICR